MFDGLIRPNGTEVESIKSALCDLVTGEQPCTVRQTFDRLVSAGVIGKTGNQYRGSVWEDQECYVEISPVKGALIGVLYNVGAQWAVPLMTEKPRPAVLSFLYSAAVTIAHHGTPIDLYYFGGHNPSRVDDPRKVEMALRQFVMDIRLDKAQRRALREPVLGGMADANVHMWSKKAPFDFEGVSVTFDQINAMDWPTLPTKRTESPAKKFELERVDVDAIPRNVLRQIVRSCMKNLIVKGVSNAFPIAEKGEGEALEPRAVTYESAVVQLKSSINTITDSSIIDLLSAQRLSGRLYLVSTPLEKLLSRDLRAG